MKEILARCASLAHLMPQDAEKLEQDIRDMISMADEIARVDCGGEESICGKPLEDFRADIPSDAPRDDALFDNAPNTCGGMLCVPHMTGV